MSDENLMQETYLKGSIVPCNVFDDLLEPGAATHASDHLMCQIGEVSKKDFVWVWDEMLTKAVLSIAKFFLKVRVAFAPDACFFAAVLKFASADHNNWIETVGSPVALLPVSKLLRKAVVNVECTDPHRVRACQ